MSSVPITCSLSYRLLVGSREKTDMIRKNFVWWGQRKKGITLVKLENRVFTKRSKGDKF
jgi:hypothetical protein